MNKDQETALRDFIWAKYGKEGTTLEWIIESKEDFTIGEIELDENGYFIPVEDAHLSRKTKEYLSEETLRRGNFSEEMKSANLRYEKRLNQEKAERERSKRKSRRLIKRGFISTLVLAGASFSAFKAYKKYNSPESVAERERITALDESAIEIIPENKALSRFVLSEKPEEYTCENGDNVVVYYAFDREINENRLYISLNNRKRFISENWQNYPEGDARVLEYIEVLTDNGWARKNTVSSEDQKEYEELITTLAKIKSKPRE